MHGIRGQLVQTLGLRRGRQVIGQAGEGYPRRQGCVILEVTTRLEV